MHLGICAALARAHIGNGTEKYDGEGGFEPPVGLFWPYNGLANCPIPQPGVRNQRLTFGRDAPIRVKTYSLGSRCATIVQPT